MANELKRSYGIESNKEFVYFMLERHFREVGKAMTLLDQAINILMDAADQCDPLVKIDTLMNLERAIQRFHDDINTMVKHEANLKS